MGIIKQGILGGFSGKVGSVIGTSWKGRAVMKAMPLSVANPKTSAQVAQRTAFSDCVAFAKNIVGGAILLLDNPFAGDISGYNRFVARNTSKFPLADATAHLGVELSNGSLGAVAIDSVNVPTAGNTDGSGSFVSNDNPLALDGDNVVLAIYSVTAKEWLLTGEVVASRDDSGFNYSTSREVIASETLIFYLSAVREDNKYVSTSVARSEVVSV